jgi:hypothetical protein
MEDLKIGDMVVDGITIIQMLLFSSVVLKVMFWMIHITSSKVKKIIKQSEVPSI